MTEQEYDGKLFYEDSQMSSAEVEAMTNEPAVAEDAEFVELLTAVYSGA